MTAYFVDETQTAKFALTVADGSTVEGVVLHLFIPLEDVDKELAEFEQGTGSLPMADQARAIARPVLGALLAYVRRAAP